MSCLIPAFRPREPIRREERNILLVGQDQQQDQEQKSKPSKILIEELD